MSGTTIEPLQTMSLDTAPPAAAPDAPADTPAEGGEGERQLTPREQQMEAIIAKRQARFAEEMHRGEVLADEARQIAGMPALEHDDDPGAGEQQPDALREAPEPRRQAAPQPAAPQPQTPTPAPQPQPAPQQLIPVDIGQQRVNVTPAQLVELARRHLIATAQQQRAQQMPPQPQPAPAAPPPAQPILSDDEAKAFHRRIAFGDSETDGAQAIRDLVQSVMSRAPAAPHVDPVQVANLAREQTLAQIRHEQNLTALGTEYPDVFQNHTLARLAALEYHNLRQEESAIGVYRADLDAYREAASRVRAAIGSSSQQPQPQPNRQNDAPAAPQAVPGQDMNTRLERKRAAPKVPTGVSRIPVAEQPRQYPDAKQVVEQMRAARFQTPMR